MGWKNHKAHAMQCIKHVEAPVVSSQGLTSMMISDLVSLAFSAPRFLAAAMRASFSSFAFCSSCRNNCYSQKPVEVCMGHGTQPHDSSSVLQDLFHGVLCYLAQTLDRQCDGICIPSAWFIRCASVIIPIKHITRLPDNTELCPSSLCKHY